MRTKPRLQVGANSRRCNNRLTPRRALRDTRPASAPGNRAIMARILRSFRSHLMRISLRVLLTAVLVTVVVGLLFLRVFSHHGFYLTVPRTVPDRSVTQPLNVPGGGPAP